MSRIPRLTCGAVIGVLSFLVVITVFAEEVDVFSNGEPAAEARAAGPAAGAAEAAPAAKAVAAETPADDVLQRFNFCRCAGQGSPVAVARIEHVLRGPLQSNGLDYTDAPLEEVVNQLQDEYGIPIIIKESALEDAGLDPSEPVTVSLNKISLRSALRLMLDKLQLTYTVHDEVVEITTYDDADSHLVACVYNARPFVGDTSAESMTALIETITSCVDADSWAENGDGKAAIRSLMPGLLAISQTQHAHDEIVSLLNAIHKMREKSTEDAGAASR